ncbi:MAG: ABC transporter ATP-binding protein [Flavobacteriaceae bacterium]
MQQAGTLTVENLVAGYGDATVLHGVSLSVEPAAITAIVGANGAGKTTLLSTIAGLVAPREGRIAFDGEVLSGRRPEEIVAKGISLVPEGGRLFSFMTVRENLELGAYLPAARRLLARRLDEVMTLFPVLADRQAQFAGKLSGGERQMCAIGRALMAGPRLLMLDEPSVGLSPLMTHKVLETVQRLVREEGITVLVVEQRVTEVLEIADFAHILDHGRVVKSGAAAQLRSDRQIQEAYMGL